MRHPSTRKYLIRLLLAALVIAGSPLYVRVASAISPTIVWRPLSAGRPDSVCNVARFRHPSDIAIDSTGDIYIASFSQYETLWEVTSDGHVKLLVPAGPALHRYPPLGAPSLALEPTGAILLGDQDGRQIDTLAPNGGLIPLAGQYRVSEHLDGAAAVALFESVGEMTVDSSGNIYVLDGAYVRKLSRNGQVTTIAGTGYTRDYPGARYPERHDGPGRRASFVGPTGIVTDRLGNLYITDVDSSGIPRGFVRKVSPQGVVTTIAGDPKLPGGHVDGVGAHARFEQISGITIDSAGNLFVVDDARDSPFDLFPYIRKIDPQHRVTTVFDGSRPPGMHILYGSGFSGFHGITVDGRGRLYVTDLTVEGVFRIDPNGIVNIPCDSGPEKWPYKAGQ